LNERLAAFGFSRGQWLVLGGTALGGCVLGFLPLFGGPGYESALGLGLLLPLPIACACAARVCPRAAEPLPFRRRSPLGALLGAFGFALLCVAVQLVIVLLHGLRAGFCNVLQGVVLFALGPAVGALLAAAWGTSAGLAAVHVSGSRRRTWAVALAALGPLSGVVLSLWRFWTSPMVFAFDPFVGFFAGTLYDTVIDAVPRLVTYRVGSAGTLLAVTCLAALLRRSAQGRVELAPARRRPICGALALLGVSVSAGVYLCGPELGHYQTTGSIRAALGHSWSSERCDIVYPSGILLERVQLLGAECDAHLAHHEAYFEVAFPERVTIFAFLSAAQKGALMGASSTYIAKPWRREVYVQSDNYPHPVLSHELAHVVAGGLARGPFRVAGPLGGWIPDPGRIEGFAVAAAPSSESDYTLLEWTRALRDLNLLPPLSSVFKLSFLGQNSSTAYTVAGAVVAWLHDAYGAEALRAWYGGAELGEAFAGKTLPVLQQEFSAELDRVQLPAWVLDLAKSRFDRPAIFGRSCPHVVDELLEDANAALQRHDVAAASAAYDASLRLDPGNFGARIGRAVCEQRRGAEQAAEARYIELGADPSLTRVQRAVVAERLGDAALLAGDIVHAERYYTEAERDALEEARTRALAVKRYAARGNGRAAVAELLIGDPERGTDLMQASASLGEWSVREPGLGLAEYLLGKNLYSRARWRDASLHLERALGRALPLPSVRREALRSQIFALCALSERQRASSSLRAYLADPELSPARREAMRRFAPVCGLPAAP
jgi:tetratricopeptide (TPR) repeat protein